jgi:cytidine deaminase
MQLYSKKFYTILKILINASQYSNRVHKHACAIIKGGKILAIDINNIRNRIINHAEQNILSRFKNLFGCFLFVIRVVKENKVADSKPCFHCIKLIKECGIKKVCFSTDVGFEIVKVSELENNHLTLHYRT